MRPPRRRDPPAGLPTPRRRQARLAGAVAATGDNLGPRRRPRLGRRAAAARAARGVTRGACRERLGRAGMASGRGREARVVESVGRAVQARLYRAGALGRRPEVPVLPRRLELAARRAMSARAWAYVAGSAGQQRTARANLEAFGRYRLVPRMLRNVAVRDLGVDLFGRRLPAPVLLAPVGVLELVHPDADSAVA